MEESLTREVIDYVVEEPHRAIAITPGADLVAVIKYALHADHRRVIRDVLLFIFLCGLIVSFP
jgi:hypothetical protein